MTKANVCIDQIEYSRAMMSNTTEKAAYLWTEINKTDDEVAKELTDENAEICIPANSVTVKFVWCWNFHELLALCTITSFFRVNLLCPKKQAIFHLLYVYHLDLSELKSSWYDTCCYQSIPVFLHVIQIQIHRKLVPLYIMFMHVSLWQTFIRIISV